MGEVWDGVAPAWKAAFQLAWESHQAGSPGVGAVIVDDEGRVVSSGRSRRAETVTTPNQLVGSRMAHAEINALAGLAIDNHPGLTLLVTLEPCLLCVAGVAISHVPRVVFAGEDPVWRYLQQLPRWDPRLAERWPRIEGPLGGPLGAWASLVPLLERLERDPRGVRVEEFERALPELVALARGLVIDGTALRIRAMELDDAIEAVWQRLPN